MADLYVCSHGQTKPCDQCAGQLENKLEPPDRIWINNPTEETEHDQRWWYDHSMAFPTVEYVRADLVFRAPVVAPQVDALALKKLSSRIGDVIEESLRSYRCQYTRELPDLENGLALVDLLTPEPDMDVTRGLQELELLADYIASDVDDEIKQFASSPSSPVPAEQGDSHQTEQWKRDLITAGWVAVSAIKWRAPNGSLWRGPYGAWKELQRQRENCSGCAASRAGVGRCRIHEPVNPAATPAPVEQEHRWRCACGWSGTPSQMVVSNDLRSCPKCGGSGGLILDAALDSPKRNKYGRDKCEHGILWSMECLSCGPSDFIAVTTTPSPSLAAREAAEEIVAELDRRALLHDSNATCPINGEVRARYVSVVETVLKRGAVADA